MVTSILINKPDEQDFVNWFENEYDITCFDTECAKIEMELNDKGESKTTILGRAESNYSPGLFNLKLQRLYRGLDNKGDMFSIEVIGFFGNFKVIEQWERIGE
ncbi:hypothetical protein ERL59_19735 [Chengkuizengella sp. YPA3-1-1]|uniref:Uncharacterized protein n=1 Tax=Chengkuizengella marina TaxID=2507566 RepID=A0A6N9Q8H2_9BACL|nr:hypothetical protein [Chengkuizengella marina]